MAKRKSNSIGVVITGGGQGLRFGRGPGRSGGNVPKQFLLLDGRPIIHYSIAVFEAIRTVREIVVVVPAGELRRTEELIRKGGFNKVSHIVVGGTERQHSVRNGLLSFDNDPDIVLVHDAVRPLVSAPVIREVIKQTAIHGAAVVGVPVKDTIKLSEKDFYTKTLDRKVLRAVQTPQGFRFDLLMRAHVMAQRAAFIGTDDASLVERLRVPVKAVEGEYRNLKITTEDDYRLAELFLRAGLVARPRQS